MKFIEQAAAADFEAWQDTASFEKSISTGLLSHLAAAYDALELLSLSKAEMVKLVNGNDESALDIVERIAVGSKAFESLAKMMHMAAERALCAAATTLQN